MGIQCKPAPDCPDRQHGPGWNTLVDCLLAEIAQHLALSPECPSVTLRQIKEKLGGLRVHYAGGDEHIEGLVRMVEAISLHTCECCGAPGGVVNEPWLRTRCTAHRDTGC